MTQRSARNVSSYPAGAGFRGLGVPVALTRVSGWAGHQLTHNDNFKEKTSC